MIRQFGNCPPLDDVGWARLQSLAEEHAAEVEYLANELVNGLEAELFDAWHGGRYIRAPYSPIGAPGFGRRVFFGKGDGHEGWTASIGFTWDDVPRLQPVHEDLEARVRVRDAALHAYLLDWRRQNLPQPGQPK